MDICVELHEHIAWGYEHINKNKFVLEKCARTLPFYTLKFYTFTPYTLTSYNFKTQKCAKTQIQFKTSSLTLSLPRFYKPEIKITFWRFSNF